jgi:hypothetical protein
VKERLTRLRVRWLHDRETDGMSHAGARGVVRAVKGHRVAEDDSAATQRVRQRCVRRDTLAFESIGFGENDVERHDGGPELAQPIDESANHVAAPWPLPDGRQAPFVDVDDDDAIAYRSGRYRPQQPIVDAVLEAGECRGPIQRKDCDDDCGNETEEQDQPT